MVTVQNRWALLALGFYAAVALAGCGDLLKSSQKKPVAAKPTPSGDIRGQTAPFYMERYMTVEDRFRRRRERLIRLLTAPPVAGVTP